MDKQSQLVVVWYTTLVEYMNDYTDMHLRSTQAYSQSVR